MVFSNLFFLYFFLPLNLICYFLAKSIHVRNGILIVFFALFLCLGRAEIRAAAGRYGADQLDLWLDD